MNAPFTAAAPDPHLDGVLKLAIMAVGGQGGGVLTNWLESVARANGYAVQATSVAGVAQRTGATIYYLEMAPESGRAPVFALLPAAGDVDVLVAAEMMEAGRAILRGFVTPDRTTLITSSHRALAVSEKIAPGHGIANAEEVMAAIESAARRHIVFDMERIAAESGTVISASLLGAIAGAGVLPFTRDAFEAAIRASGRGEKASLAAFAKAYDIAAAGGEGAHADRPAHDVAPPVSAVSPAGPARLLAEWRELAARAASLPEPARDMALAGLRKVVDFQDVAYGRAYLDRLDAVKARDDAARGWLLTREAAKYIANAMAYDDVIRVADLKTRPDRIRRIAREMQADEEKVLHLTEFFHPRAEELVGLLPARIGAAVASRPGWMRWIDRHFGKGRRLRSDRLWPFLQLYLVGGLRRWRRATLRYREEEAHLQNWLAAALAHLPTDYDLAVETLRARRLIKGYSDTHARGVSKYDRVMAGITRLAGRPDAADWARRLREAAMRDEKGDALDGMLATIRSFL